MTSLTTPTVAQLRHIMLLARSGQWDDVSRMIFMGAPFDYWLLVAAAQQNDVERLSWIHEIASHRGLYVSLSIVASECVRNNATEALAWMMRSFRDLDLTMAKKLWGKRSTTLLRIMLNIK